MRSIFIISFLLLGMMAAKSQESDRAIRLEIMVEASIEDTWNVWTTPEGIKSFFAPDCNIEYDVDGPYEMFFVPDAEPGMRGGEGNRILAIQPHNMFAFSWNAPPHLPNVRKQRTHVVIRFFKISATQTKVTLFHDGWGEGEQWDKAFDYFSKAWEDVVLPRLKYRFSHGPIDWTNPPDVKKE